MNKFLAFALFALVASVSCGPVEKAENPETELLMGEEKRLFSDFCIAQGEKIKNDLNKFQSETSVKITEIFFGSVNEITDDVINVQKDAVAQLTAQLANPSTEIVDGEADLSEDQIAKLIREGKEAIQETNGIAGVLPASKAAFSAMLSAANSALFTRLAKARSVISGLNLYNAFKNACAKVAAYEIEMSDALEQAKEGILENTESEEVIKFVKDVSIVNLNCFTTKNIVRLHGFCDTLQAGHVHFFKMLGMESPLQKYEQEAESI